MFYKQASYEGKGHNHFYFMSYVNPEWFFEGKTIIHPDCKEIMDSDCDDFVDVETFAFLVVSIRIEDKTSYSYRNNYFVKLSSVKLISVWKNSITINL